MFSTTSTIYFSLAKKILVSFLTAFVLLFGVAQAQTYTTISNGFINDPGIWSTDGGITPCNCSPVAELPTAFILNAGSCEINHNVFFTRRVIILGTGITININASGALTGTSPLELRTGVINNYGSFGASDVSVQNGGFLNNQNLMSVTPGNLVNMFQGRINLAGRTNIPNGNFTNDGMIDIRGSATVFVGGRLNNNQFINMEPSACLQVIGDLTNFSTGFISLINGPGKAFVQSNSNINNLGTWDTDVDYCVGGVAIGLAHPQNCVNCGILPVELAGFEAEMDNGQVILSWETIEELDNNFFTIERSNDGKQFEELMQVESSSPVNGRVYQAFDIEPFFGISYYRLSQTDMNGTTRKLETVLVNNAEAATRHFNAFPNPFTDAIRVTTFGMGGAPVSILVTDLSGKVVARKEIDQTADFDVYEVQPQELPTGMYLVVVRGNKVTESFKLFHK